MSLSYANLTTRVLQWLQDTGAATYDATETGHAVEDELKRLSQKAPFELDVIYKVESRYGTVSATSSGNLTDTTKSQFLAADATNELVVHNITDDTWGTISSFTSSSVLAVNSDIFVSGDSYEIYNKRCKNKRQIYLGELLPYLGILAVEYPIGVERNFKQISRDVIELDVWESTIEDSNSTLSTLRSVDVLVKFAMPQVLCQLTDLAGEVDLGAGYAAGVTAMHVDGLGATEVIEPGELFNLENQRTTYIITATTTLAANEGDITFWPGLEAAVVDNDDITFVKSTLQPNHEDLLTRMVVSHAVQSDSIRHAKSSLPRMANYQKWINDNPRQNEQLIQRELNSLVEKRPSGRHPR